MLGAFDDWLILGAFLVVGIASLIRLPNMWRGEDNIYPKIRRWPLPDPLLRGWARSMPLLVVLTWVLLFLAVFAFTAPPGAVATSPLTRLLLLLVLLVFLLMVTVTLFNAPKFAVPPPQRGEPGALAQWFSGSKRRD